MNILITGGVGFIGSNASLHFGKKKKNKIVIVDNFSRYGVKENAYYLKDKIKNIKIIKANINQVKKYLSELKKADVVIHLAGQTAVTTSIKNPLLDFQSNLKGGFSILEATRKYNPGAVIIYASTNKVYGNLSHHRLKKDSKNKSYCNLDYPKGIDDKQPLDFISPYGCSKGAVDQYFQDYYRIFKLKTVVFRQSCIYGPLQLGVEDQGWVAHFSKQFFLKNSINIFGNGYQIRDLLYVDDLINAYELAIENIDKVQGKAINIGGGIKNSFSLVQIIKYFEKIFKYKAKINYYPERLGDQKYFVSANKKVKELLGWKAETEFKNGVMKMIDWQKKYFKK